MSLTDIKNKSQGFTIVELLIVVVVIAILAAITIVSYNGITNRANASAAKSTAASIQKKIELYQADQGRYPISVAEMSGSTDTDKAWYITNGSLTPSGGAVSSSNGKTRVQVVSCGNATPAAGNVTGAKITWYDYEKSSSQATDIIVGTCTTPGTNGATAWAGPAL
jgi:prepilin-type N-terminal cleavage/methylation domain-containing protein